MIGAEGQEGSSHREGRKGFLTLPREEDVIFDTVHKFKLMKRRTTKVIMLTVSATEEQKADCQRFTES